MSATTEHDDPVEALWRLPLAQPQISPMLLANAVERAAELGVDKLDHRSRLLIRDVLDALERHWGRTKFQGWLNRSRASLQLTAVRHEQLGQAGFPTLAERLMEPTRKEDVEQFLRELGARVTAGTTVYVGGSGALILSDKLSRGTDDVDVVDEVPLAIRNEHELLADLRARYGLSLTYFQSRDLPDDWQSRASSLGRFGKLDVYLVDPTDIFVGKLFSARTKDLDDLRALAPQLDRGAIEARLGASAMRLRADPGLLSSVDKNWYIVFGDALPG